MNSLNAQKILEACPILFSNKDRREPINVFGFECGDGWFNLLYEACTKIEAIISKKNQREQANYGVAQIKEKFGTLRFYMNGGLDEEIHQIIGVAEDKSEVTCERCGEPGTLRGKRWMVTQCDNCEEELLEAKKSKHD